MLKVFYVNYSIKSKIKYKVINSLELSMDLKARISLKQFVPTNTVFN